MKKQWMFWCIIFFCIASVDAAFLVGESCAVSSKKLCTVVQQQMSSHILKRRLQRLSEQKLETKKHNMWKPRLQISDSTTTS